MALTYDEIKTHSKAVKTLTDKAVDELSEKIGMYASEGRSRYQVATIVRQKVRAVADKYGASAQELGAQWYEYCARKAGVDVEPAVVGEIDYDGIDAHFQNLLDDYVSGGETWAQVETKIADVFENELRGLERGAIIENLDRDERTSRRGGRKYNAGYARVPVGETCAWCFMLASLGYWYRSYESAGGLDPDHYHMHCDCDVVAYNDPTDIDGYDDYAEYQRMYYDAKADWDSKNISDDMAKRIEAAKQQHMDRYEAGIYKQPWTQYNAVLMIMRENEGLEH